MKYCPRCKEYRPLSDYDPTRRHCAQCILQWLVKRVAKRRDMNRILKEGVDDT